MRYLEEQGTQGGDMGGDMGMSPAGSSRPVKPKKKPGQGGAGAPEQAPQQPPTFAQMQKSGYARPPMPAPSGVQRVPNGIITTTAPKDGSPSPWGPQNPGAQPGGRTITSTAGDGFGSPPAAVPGGRQITSSAGDGFGANLGVPGGGGGGNFDPMAWLQQQVIGGAQGEMGRAYDYLGSRIDDDYALREQALQEEMASRGLADSTVYGGRMQDLNVGRRSAKADLGERLGGNSFNNSMSALQSLVGLGQQGFQNDMTYNQWLMQMLGIGYGG